MHYEKTQKGNPHALTICQHTFPVASIARFAGSDGRVDLFLLQHGKQIRVKPDNQLFCAKRTWDQRAESGFMKEIEDKYQELADSIFSGKTQTINNAAQSIVTDMFALWNIRVHRKASPIDDQKIMDVIEVARHYTKNEQEILEKNGFGIIRPDSTISGRHLSGSTIQSNLFKVRKQMTDPQWGILRASKSQFLVPDNFPYARILPLSPTICLFSQSYDEVIDDKEVFKINQMALDGSKEYYFANDLSIYNKST